MGCLYCSDVINGHLLQALKFTASGEGSHQVHSRPVSDKCVLLFAWISGYLCSTCFILNNGHNYCHVWKSKQINTRSYQISFPVTSSWLHWLENTLCWELNSILNEILHRGSSNTSFSLVIVRFIHKGCSKSKRHSRLLGWVNLKAREY